MRYSIFNQRKQNRLVDYDYSEDGWYFVTICTKNKLEFFGKIENGKMVLNEFGEIARECWLEIQNHFLDVSLDEFVIMPNHIHGILIIENVGNMNSRNISVGDKNFCSLQPNVCSIQNMPWQTKLSKSLSSIIRGFKIGVTKYFHENNIYYFQWHKSFYDHIIRNEKSLNNIRQYIHNNPLKWMADRNNEENLYY